jgi:hypothetical protein
MKHLKIKNKPDPEYFKLRTYTMKQSASLPKPNNHRQLLRYENDGPELYCYAQNNNIFKNNIF